MRTRDLRVLLIEDDPGDARRVQELMSEDEDANFNVVRCDRLSTSASRLSQGGIDVILLDLSLPDSQGLDALRGVQGHAPETPVIVMTGADDRERALRAVEEGAQDYLIKGELNGVVLAHVVRHAVERHRMLAEIAQRTAELEAGEARLRTLIDRNPDGIVVVDGRGTVRFVNPGAEALFGRKADELVGEAFGLPVTAGETTEVDVIGRGGTHTTAEMRVVETEWEGESAVLASLRDITERKRAEEALKESGERYRELFEQSPIGILEEDYSGAKSIVDRLRKKGIRDFRRYFREHPKVIGKIAKAIKLVDVNQALLDLYRVSEKEAYFRTAADPARIKQWRSFYEEKLAALAEGESRVVQEYADKTFDGSDIVIQIITHIGEAYKESWARVVTTIEDITERKRAEAQLLHDAFHDPLTGLANRALFMDRLGHAVKRLRRRDGLSIAVLFIDLDRFKVVNDSLGHSAGDEMLCALGERLEEVLRPGDTIARLGGDEFTILIEDVKGPAGATALAQRLQSVFAAPVKLAGREVYASASIGIALGAGDQVQPEDLLRDADLTMYRAKAQGGGRCELFDEGLHTQAMERLDLETDLRHAVERDELELHYQPIVSLKAGTIVGFEGLARWRHRQKGLIMPGDFIPVAEDTGIIVALGRWVIETACRQLSNWRRDFGPAAPEWISVNVSPRQFAKPDLTDTVFSNLGRYGLEGSDLKLEITESVIMENPEAAGRILEELKARGVRLCIDDFGTGYSSLSSLHRFPVEILKIDRSFVSPMDGGDDTYEIVSTIILLAHNLKMTVVAEGVETIEQVERLRALGCEFAQGFYYAAPLDLAAATELIAKTPSWQTATGRIMTTVEQTPSELGRFTM